MELASSKGLNCLGSEEVNKLLDMVRAVAREVHRKLPRSVEFDDLYQNGVIGLMEAARKYDKEKGVPFLPYARFRVRGAILDGLRRIDTFTRRQRKQMKQAEFKEESLGQPRVGFVAPIVVSTAASFMAGGDSDLNFESRLAAGLDSSPYRQLQTAEAQRVIELALEGMSARHRQMIRMLYYHDLNAKEVAKRFHVNESRVSQIRGIALRKMSVRLEESGLKLGDLLEDAC